MESNKVSVKIYGQEYVITGEKSREHIMKVADYVDRKMYEIGQAVKGGPASSLAVLSAVNVADEYFDAQEQIEALKKLNEQLEKDSEHYVQLWDEAKTSFIQYKEDSQTVVQQKEELSRVISEKEREIQYLKDEAKLASEREKESADEALRELSEKCREMENNFFDLQMENIQLKSELDRRKKEF